MLRAVSLATSPTEAEVRLDGLDLEDFGRECRSRLRGLLEQWRGGVGITGDLRGMLGQQPGCRRLATKASQPIEQVVLLVLQRPLELAG